MLFFQLFNPKTQRPKKEVGYDLSPLIPRIRIPRPAMPFFRPHPWRNLPRESADEGIPPDFQSCNISDTLEGWGMPTIIREGGFSR